MTRLTDRQREALVMTKARVTVAAKVQTRLNRLQRLFPCLLAHDWQCRPIYDHEGGFSHVEARCSRCPAAEERWIDFHDGGYRSAGKPNG